MIHIWMLLETNVLKVRDGRCIYGIRKNFMLKTKQTSKKPSSIYQKSLENDIPTKASIFWFLNTITHRKKKKIKNRTCF